MLAICTCIKKLSKKCSASTSKDIKIFFIKELCWTIYYSCHLPCRHWKSCKFLSHFHFGWNSSWASYCTFCYASFKMSPAVFLTTLDISYSIQPFLLDMLWLYEDRNCNTQGAFEIIFFIRRNLLNCLKSISTHYIIII